MTIKIFTSIILVLILASCNNTRTQDNSKQEMPKALEDNSDKGLSYVKSGRGYEDLIESLYKELESKLEDAKAMLLDKLPLVQIAKYTGLTIV